MYHDVHADRASAPEIPRTAALYHLSKATFAAQLDALTAAGVAVRSLGEFLGVSEGDSVILTFDDGWAGSLSTGVEALVDRGQRATFFVTTEYVGKRHFASSELLRDAYAAGMELGTHGATHRYLAGLPASEIDDELASSKTFLEDLLGAPATTGSVPGGAWSPLVATAARERGYTALCTSRPGIIDERTDRLALQRVAIRRTTSLGAVERYARFRVAREVVRATALDVPRRLLGRERYATTRARVLDGAT